MSKLNDDERAVQYAECIRRGHQTSNRVLTSNPPWQVCRFCGTHFRYEQRLIEQNEPRGPRVAESSLPPNSRSKMPDISYDELANWLEGAVQWIEREGSDLSDNDLAMAYACSDQLDVERDALDEYERRDWLRGARLAIERARYEPSEIMGVDAT